MDTAELKKIAAEKGLPAISVTLPDEDTPSPPRFDGTLDEFWVAAKTLGTRALLLRVMQMDESDFHREVPSEDVPEADEEDDSFDGESYSVDLEEALPSISKFRKHVGKDCAFIMTAKGGFAEVDYLLTETWWDEFQEEADKAVESWIASRNEKFGEVEAEKEKKAGKLIDSLKELIHDRDFCLLRTHRARIAYAIEKLPDLAELSEFVLKPEIQKLSDRIEAKGLNRKSRN